MALVAAARTEIVLTVDGVTGDAEENSIDETDDDLRKKAAQLKGPSEAALALFTAHNVDVASDSGVMEAATVNPHFKLLMRLISWESAECEPVRRRDGVRLSLT